MSTRRYQVSDVARMAGVSVRTLHHYDEIGLLRPSARSPAGYRLYDDDDLVRLQQILVHRALGFSLEQIRAALDRSVVARVAALREQRARLVRRAEETAAMIRGIDRALVILTGKGADEMDRKELFDGFDPAAYEEEAEERWGDTEAWRVSSRRAKGYAKEDWARLRDEQAALYGAAAEAMRSGARPDSEAGMDAAENLRLFIERWFYPCSHAMHERLADLYEADARFAASIDGHGAGLTPWLVAAIRANAARNR